MRTSIV